MAHVEAPGLVNPELEEERKKCTFIPSELTHILDGGPSSTAERHEIEQKFAEDPNFPRYVEFAHLGTDEYYSKTIGSCIHMQRKLEELNLTTQIPGNLQYVHCAHISNIAVPASSPVTVHFHMFVTALMSLATEEQQTKWLSPARKLDILGAYCMTELGHGSNVNGLETTATYDPQKDEFVLNSPTLTSLKVWAGLLGRTASAAIVFAQLYIHGVCHGIHAFFVQLRSFDDHTSLPGITIGEMGPKMGLHTYDNGFLKLDQVRIPRTNMLMRQVQVHKDGTFVKSKNRSNASGTLMMVRADLILLSTLHLAQAATIAVRYNAIRRQGGSENPGEPETKILDYQTQQYKLFPQVATAYAGIFAFKMSRKKMLEAFANPTASSILEIQTLIFGLKALCTQSSASGIEQCRLSCGGMGYMTASRFQHLYASTTASSIFDGESTVLLLYTAKLLMRAYQNLKNGKQVGSTFEYLDSSRMGNRDWVIKGDDELEKLQRIFCKTTAGLVSHVAEKVKRCKTEQQIYNNQSIEMVKCMCLHLQCFILNASCEFMMAEEDMSDSLKTVLKRLFKLLALYWIRTNAGEFIQYGGVLPSEMAMINSRFTALLEELRPDIVGLVDAFDFRDESLQSIIGCYDGRVYERVYDYFMKLPTNQAKVHPVFEKSLNPARQSKL